MNKPMSLETMKRNVRRGRKVLETRFGPEWFKQIDKDNLRMHAARTCVLGQMFKDRAETYFDGVKELTGWKDEANYKARDRWAKSHGFYLPLREYGNQYGDNVAAYGVLGDLWKEQFKLAERKLHRQPKQQELPLEPEYKLLTEWDQDGEYTLSDDADPEYLALMPVVVVCKNYHYYAKGSGIRYPNTSSTLKYRKVS